MGAGSPVRVEQQRQRHLGRPWPWLLLLISLSLSHALGQHEALLRLNPLSWLLALPAGHLLFAWSVLFTRLDLRLARGALRASLSLLYRPYDLETMGFYLLVALSEEILFRLLPLSLWASPWSLLIAALIFTLSHSAKRLSLLPALDLLLFALLLGLWFRAGGDLISLCLIHWIRNGSLAKVFVRQGSVAS